MQNVITERNLSAYDKRYKSYFDLKYIEMNWTLFFYIWPFNNAFFYSELKRILIEIDHNHKR